jgi:hypothetical protein
VLEAELDRIKREIRETQQEIDALLKGTDRSDVEHEERMREQNTRLKQLREQRAALHRCSPETLSEDEIDLLIDDIGACQEELQGHRDWLRNRDHYPGSRERLERQHELAWNLNAVIEEYTRRLEALSKGGAVSDPEIEWADCQRCGHRITRLSGSRRWSHCDRLGQALGAQGGWGCRDACLEREGDWNDDYPKTWTATPKWGTETHQVPRRLSQSWRSPSSGGENRSPNQMSDQNDHRSRQVHPPVSPPPPPVSPGPVGPPGSPPSSSYPWIPHAIAGFMLLGLGLGLGVAVSGSDGSKASDKQCADWAYAIQGANSSDPTRRLHASGATGAEARAKYDRYCR